MKLMVLGSVNNLSVQYVSTAHEAWAAQLPHSNWLLLAIADEAAQVPNTALTVCLHRSPAGIGCTGQWAATLEDDFDMEIVLQALEWEEQHQLPFDYDYAPVTTADPDLAEALWYAVNLAPNMATEAIDTVVCLDFTRQQEARLRDLLPLLATGWLLPGT
ncbi:hypothetical protein [Hymenobacter canadensis]|uniref:Uncharacterized protein n=1 Tax=Hymenobacter canadensis TaxID=2999067 RepID=A0ABY7LIH6_9BACT|nr:hypothetical protein [Hymenobacter canadensis]WBA40251.1 hypothetical protein O3303_10455 [Hymenobacter canadensis]